MTAALEARGLRREFGHVRALDGADFDVDLGEVVALIGDNGAGKSTLVKALSGSLAIDSGEILSDGRPVTLDSPAAARSLGMRLDQARALYELSHLGAEGRQEAEAITSAARATGVAATHGTAAL